MGWFVVETEPFKFGHGDWAIRDQIAKLGFRTLLIEAPHLTPPKYRFAPPAILILPRYVFAEFDVAADHGMWQRIRRIDHVKNILGMTPNHAFPTQVRNKDVARLQELAHEIAMMPKVSETKIVILKPETVIRILWEPLAGMTGKVKFDNGIRADVLLASAGLARKISLPRELIEPISKAVYPSRA